MRFLIGDTGNPPYLSDDEIDYLLAKSNGDVVKAAYRGVMALLAKAAQKMTKTVGPTTLNYAELTDNWRALLDELAAMGGAAGLRTPGLPTAGGIEDPLWSDKDWTARLRG